MRFKTMTLLTMLAVAITVILIVSGPVAAKTSKCVGDEAEHDATRVASILFQQHYPNDYTVVVNRAQNVSICTKKECRTITIGERFSDELFKNKKLRGEVILHCFLVNGTRNWSFSWISMTFYEDGS